MGIARKPVNRGAERVERCRPAGRARLAAFALAFLAHAANGGIGTWTSIGFDGVETGPIAAHSSASRTIYAGVDGILMKTFDGGAHWLDARPYPGFDRPLVLVEIDPASPTTAYAGLESVFPGGGAVSRTVDGAASWSQAYDGRYNEDATLALAIAPSRPGTLYVAGANVPGVIKSTDSGASWTVLANGFVRVAGTEGLYTFPAIAVDPATADNVYAAETSQVLVNGHTSAFSRLYKSSDGGASWIETWLVVPAGTTITRLAIDPANPATIYVVYRYPDGPQPEATKSDVLKSTDAGASWSKLRSPTPEAIADLVIDPADSRRLYVACAAGVFRSIDGGATWSAFSDGLPAPGVTDLAIDGSGALLRAATPTGLFEYRYPPAASEVVPVVEYYHAAFDHYFMTAFPGEIARLDAGETSGWTPTGYLFNAHAVPASATSPTCRYYTAAFAGKASHFYSAFATECATLRANAQWSLETDAAFHAAVPSADGACPPDHAPVYRLYNDGQGGAPNHRYTSDPAVRAQMIARGWVPEGRGADGVQMCSPL